MVQIPDRARIGQTAFMTSEYVLTLGCPDRTGIVARIATLIADAGGSITEAGYHADPDTNWFFTRQVVSAESLSFGFAELRTRFAALAAEFGAPDGWRVRDARKPRRVVVLVSREGHCLYDLLGRYTGGELNMAIRAVVANHTDLAAITRAHDIPFHHVEFAPGAQGKRAAFDEIRTLVDAEEPDAVVRVRRADRPGALGRQPAPRLRGDGRCHARRADRLLGRLARRMSARSARGAKNDLSELVRSLGHACGRDFETLWARCCSVTTGVAEHTFDSCGGVDHQQIRFFGCDAVCVRNVLGQEDDTAL